MQVIVTGAAGFVGQHLVRRLEEQGAAVTAVVGPGRTAAAGVPVDVGEVDAMRGVLDATEPSIVFHLAGTATREAGTGPEAFEVNSRGTAALLQAVQATGAPVRVVVASTDALTGRPPGDHYERSKAATEAAAVCARAEHGLDVVIARLANVYGPGDRSRHRLVPAAASAVAAGQGFEPVSPSSVLDLVHVADVTAALVRLGQRAEEPVHRIASGTHVTVGAVVSFVQAIAREEAPPVLDVSPYASSVPLVPGWTPEIALAPGLEATIRWYLERSPDQGAD